MRKPLEEVLEEMKLPFQPAELQLKDAVEAAELGRYALFLEVGCGKTFVSTVAAKMWDSPFNLVICPPILNTQWADWLISVGEKDVGIFAGPRRTTDMLDHKWVVMSHAIFRMSFEAIKHFYLKKELALIVDECFPAGTKVMDREGQPKNIEDFSVGQEVLTSSGPKKIAKIFKGLTRALVTLELSNGNHITCTPNHPIFTELGWLAAENCSGRRVLHHSHLSDVRRGVQKEAELAHLCGPTRESDRANLLQSLRDESQSHTIPGDIQTCGGETAGQSGNRTSGSGNAPRATHTRTQTTSLTESQGSWTEAEGSRREWYRNDCGRESSLAGTGASRDGVELPSVYRQRPARVSSLLQARLRSRDIDGRVGSGWVISQNDGEEATGCEEDAEIGELRVESVSHLKRECPENTWNFEVEGCPHYFAGGILVHNCQALKNPDSKLFKYVNQLTAPDRNLLMLTATPTSKPQDTYTYMKLKTPTLYRSWGHWQNLHVAERDIFGTITAYQNLDMLADRFAMQSVKRSKKDIFGDTLDPIYQPMPYELDPKHQKLYERLAEEQLLLLENGDKIDATTSQRLRHALQQIVVNYGKFSGNPDDRSKAFDIIDSVVSEVDPMNQSKSKLVIWTYYVSTSESVTKYLQDQYGKKAVVAAYGKVNSQKSIDAIMNDPEARILIAQPSSCGVGLNLQHVCWENLFIEMSTIPMQIRQSIGRTSRIGQKYRPTMRFAQAKRTIQIRLFANLLKNDDLVTTVERSPQSLRQEIFGE